MNASKFASVGCFVLLFCAILKQSECKCTLKVSFNNKPILTELHGLEKITVYDEEIELDDEALVEAYCPNGFINFGQQDLYDRSKVLTSKQPLIDRRKFQCNSNKVYEQFEDRDDVPLGFPFAVVCNEKKLC